MRKINTRSIINFDNSATTYPKPPAVAKAVAQAVERYGGNPGRSGHKLSMRVSEKIFTVRQQAAEMFGAQTENVAFTANCTHALNMAIKGVMQYGGHMIISDHEHNAVARPVYALSKTRGVKYSIARTGETDSETVENTGRLMPYRELAALCKAHGICFIADGAQACGLLELSLSDGFNFLCTAGHKALYGPTGTGLLISDGEYSLSTIIEGGTGATSALLEQTPFLPEKLESGTINTVGIIGLGEGLTFVSQKTPAVIKAHEEKLCRQLYEQLSDIDKIKFYEADQKKVPILSFNIGDIPSAEIASYLSEKGFALRGGLQCAAVTHTTLGTIEQGTVRFSPSAFSTPQQVTALSRTIKIFAANN